MSEDIKTCKFYTQEQANINGFGLWHYMIDSPIGQYHIIEYEEISKELSKQKIFIDDNESAEKYFKSCIKKVGK